MHRHGQLLAHRPHGVVARMVIGLVRLPHRRDQDAAAQTRLADPSDLGDRRVDVDHDRHDRHTGPALGALVAQLGQPPVVRPSTGEQQVGRCVAADAEAGAERCRRATRDRVGIREDDLADHAVGLELLVATGRIPAALQSFLVLLVPRLGELLVEEAGAAAISAARARSSRKSSNRPRYSGSSHSRYSGPGRPAWVSLEMTRYRLTVFAPSQGSLHVGRIGAVEHRRRLGPRMVSSVRSLAGRIQNRPSRMPWNASSAIASTGV